MKVWVVYMSSQRTSLLCAGFFTVILRVWFKSIKLQEWSPRDAGDVQNPLGAAESSSLLPNLCSTCVPPWSLAQFSTVPANPCLKPLGLNCRALWEAEGEQLHALSARIFLPKSLLPREIHILSKWRWIVCLVPLSYCFYWVKENSFPTLKKSLDTGLWKLSSSWSQMMDNDVSSKCVIFIFSFFPLNSV